jgi:hypothetical protein
MKPSFCYALLALCLFSLIIFSSGCKKEDPMEPDEMIEDPMEPDTTGTDSPSSAQYAFGWTGEDNLDEVPTSTNFGFGSGSLPASVNLVEKFPPIGDQNPYGTCVAWAVAYNLKTALNGMSQGLSTAQLASTANQFSPKDLFVAIPDNAKGADCNGTNFSEALNLMQNRGVATVQTVPYTSLGNCSSSNVQSSWTSEAGQHKISYWRKIEASVSSIKQNLSNNIPVVLGAKLADNFMSWNSDAVLSSSTSFNNVGQHAYHAMIIAGYDDAKGARGAFLVINSWGEFWGDRGYIWVDYDYMMNEFCVSGDGSKPLFIAADAGDGGNTPPNNDPTPTPNTSGVDLAPWVFSDVSTYQNSGNPTERSISFNLYNIGTEAARSSANWSFYYIYYNAYDANDYGVLFYDNFNTSVQPDYFECPGANNCVFNIPIPAGGSFTEYVWGLNQQSRGYYMPQITGQYYLLMIADAEDAFEESDELNNFFYTTQEPKYFENGYSFRRGNSGGNTDANGQFLFENPGTPTAAQLKVSPFHSGVSVAEPNAYTRQEIADFLQREHASGRLARKVDTYLDQQHPTPYDQ